MGIPSYYSYLIKNYPNIISQLSLNNLTINNLFLDSNSIIYDTIHSINIKNEELNFNTIILNVIKKLEEYISIIKPNNLIYISFDGVAPVAKLNQQRDRRFKSNFTNNITNSINKNTNKKWDTCNITPGTQFMKQLDIQIKSHFINKENKYNTNKIIISSSIDYGEGEHKIFDYIRNNNNINHTSIIYGLDADLIMLTINHLPINNNIYLFRETPHFIKTINSELEPNLNYFMNIPLLAKSIIEEMYNYKQTNINNSIYDYIILGFFLGNDFMPHFPALNIRTGGMNKMITAYQNTIGNANTNLINIDNFNINWKNIRKLVYNLKENELEYIQNETVLRNKKEKYYITVNNTEELYQKFDLIPTYERTKEKYINPFSDGWEYRYYKLLFNIDNTDDLRVKEICINYLEGIEWTFKYYSSGCIDWRWHYKYKYPPLLVDLYKYIPYFDKSFFPKNNNTIPVTDTVQLSYVLPPTSWDLLDKKVTKKLELKKEEWYKNECDFCWVYCKYFWEAHTELPDININELEKIIL
jgi:5'-3' exoribonuclease 1